MRDFTCSAAKAGAGKRAGGMRMTRPDPDAKRFVKSICAMIGGEVQSYARTPVRSRVKYRAGQAAAEAYTRYLKRHEVQVSPRHNKLEALPSASRRRRPTPRNAPQPHDATRHRRRTVQHALADQANRISSSQITSDRSESRNSSRRNPFRFSLNARRSSTRSCRIDSWRA